MDLSTFETLRAAPDLLAEVAASTESDLALGTRLRRTHDAALVAATMAQRDLRRRAIPKFGDDASRLFFTPDALEQSTRGSVARLRAERLAASGARAVLDLGCGIGGDLIAFAQAGLRVRGVELDEVRAAIARANLEALGLDGEIVTGDASDVAVSDDEVPFLDPARRDGAGRVFDPERMSPPWTDVVTWLARGAVVKTLPGLPHALVPDAVEAQWVSDGGQLVEACLWGPPRASAPRRASVLPSGAELTGAGEPAEVGSLGAFLVEPDDAVIRSGLVGALGAEISGRVLDPHIAYLTCDALPLTPLGRAFRVVEELPFRDKPLKAALVARDIGSLTVKKRGVDVVPEDLVKRLKLKGSRPATIVMTRVVGEGRVFLVERVD